MATGYHPERSQVKDGTMAEWLIAPVTGSLLEVPGVGPATVKVLQANGVNTTYQLFAKFLSFKDEGWCPCFFKLSLRLSLFSHNFFFIFYPLSSFVSFLTPFSFIYHFVCFTFLCHFLIPLLINIFPKNLATSHHNALSPQLYCHLFNRNCLLPNLDHLHPFPPSPYYRCWTGRIG